MPLPKGDPRPDLSMCRMRETLSLFGWFIETGARSAAALAGGSSARAMMMRVSLVTISLRVALKQPSQAPLTHP